MMCFPVNGALKEIGMVEDRAPPRRRRLGAHGMTFRRRRIFACLREGFTYDEIADSQAAKSSTLIESLPRSDPP